MPEAKIVKKKQFSKLVVALVIFMNVTFTYKILEVFKVIGAVTIFGAIVLSALANNGTLPMP